MSAKTLAEPSPYRSHASSPTRHASLLGLVIAFHVGAFLLIMAAKTVAPKVLEMPLIVDMLPPMEKLPEPKPQPVAKALPVHSKPLPAPVAPLIEATQSTTPAPGNTPAASPPDTRPSQFIPAEAPVSQARFDADYLKNPAPPYPPLSKRMGEEGKVVLRVQVSAQGTAEAVEIRTSSGNARLDESAQKTVQHWRFIPARRGDTPVQSWVLIPIIFKLEQ